MYRSVLITEQHGLWYLQLSDIVDNGSPDTAHVMTQGR